MDVVKTLFDPLGLFRLKVMYDILDKIAGELIAELFSDNVIGKVRPTTYVLSAVLFAHFGGAFKRRNEFAVKPVPDLLLAVIFIFH